MDPIDLDVIPIPPEPYSDNFDDFPLAKRWVCYYLMATLLFSNLSSTSILSYKSRIGRKLSTSNDDSFTRVLSDHIKYPKGKSAMMSVGNAFSVRRVSFITNLSRMSSYMPRISNFSESALK
jgi:hypothetical protein